MKQLIYIFLITLTTIIFVACGSANVSGTLENTSNKTVQNAVPKAIEKPKEKIEEKSADNLVELFDGRKNLDIRDASKEDAELAQAEVDRKKAEISERFGDKYCNEDESGEIGINGIANGSFTKPKSKQKAVFYVLCSSGSSKFGVGGIIIFENEKAVSHYVYGENGLDSGLSIASDINKNGVDELILIDFQVHQGYGGGAISLVEFPDGKLNFIGTAATSADNSGAVEDDKKIKANAVHIFVQPGASPVFYRDSYEKKGSAKNWTLVKRLEKFTLNKLEPQFLAAYKKIN